MHLDQRQIEMTPTMIKPNKQKSLENDQITYHLARVLVLSTEAQRQVNSIDLSVDWTNMINKNHRK